MKREDLVKVTLLMQEQKSKNENEIQLLKDKQKELEFMNAMLSDRLALEQRRRFGKSSEKYADGYEQLCLFNEAEMNTDVEDTAYPIRLLLAGGFLSMSSKEQLFFKITHSAQNYSITL